MSRKTHPLRLIRFPLLRHLLADAIGIPEGPNRQLVQDAQFQENIKVQESLRNLLVPERVRNVWCFRIVLTSRVLIEVIKTISKSILLA